MMRRFGFSVVALAMMIAMGVGTASAWEFNMAGAWTWEWEYASQLGTDGFFGPHDTDASPGAGAANFSNINFWAGSMFPGTANGGSFTSGNNASSAVQYMILEPTIKINKALKIQGAYYIGQWANNDAANVGLGDVFVQPGLTNASEYLNSSLRGVQRSFSPGYWNWLRIKANLPWGSVSLGKRGSKFGIGLFNDGDHNTSSESCSFSAPYGPLSIGISFYPSRSTEGYYNPFDASSIREVNFAWGAKYRSGPIEMGFSVGHASRWRGAERQDPGFNPAGTRNTRDRHDLDMGVYVKYNNGRFFFNAEGREYDRRDVLTDTRWVNGRKIYADKEIHGWGVETGFYTGPMKFSALVASISGPDRRAFDANYGTSIFKDNSVASASDNFSNHGLFLPYAYQMVYGYGLGYSVNPWSTRGFFDSAFGYGGRLDYAVAANLNIAFSFFKAHNPYKGFGWGYLAPDDTGGLAPDQKEIGTLRSPAIPDDDLGYEFGFWMDWQLLEGLVLNSLVTYYQPGNWFKHACTSSNNPAWLDPTTDTVTWGIQPDRAIDPVIGAQVLANFEF